VIIAALLNSQDYIFGQSSALKEKRFFSPLFINLLRTPTILIWFTISDWEPVL
jgi:hypothetical protein